jgi:hypothetical protein
MGLVFRPLLHPAFEDPFLLLRHDEIRFGRRHQLTGMGGADAADQLAPGRIARYDGVLTGILRELGQGRFRQVEPQAGLLLFFIRTMAGETLVGQDGLDVKIEIHPLRKRGELFLCFRRTPQQQRDGQEKQRRNQKKQQCRTHSPSGFHA